MRGDLETYVKQFGMWRGLRVGFASKLQRKLDRFGKTSYAQMGEDRMIENLLDYPVRLDDAPEGFYVDVGCNHPQHLSNTFTLYKRGWRGICIDASEKHAANYRSVRPRDIVVTSAVSNEEAEVLFTEFRASSLSTISPEHAARRSESQSVTAQKLVRTTTLTRLLSEHSAPRSFQLLSIDVEGHDHEVLISLDLELYRPRLVVIEMGDLAPADLDTHPIYRHLVERGYSMVGYMENGYFLDSVS